VVRNNVVDKVYLQDNFNKTKKTAYGLRSLAHGRVAHGADLVFVGMIFVWAWLEITEGANGFRRLLGVVVLFWIVSSRI
jgi:hypothetical protein